jgi:hypothetical protein
MEPDDARFLRVAIDLARHARAGGADPFGAALVRDGVVVHQIADRCVELSDPTFHAELSVVSEYRHAARQFSLAGMTLYSSAKPYPICARERSTGRASRASPSAFPGPCSRSARPASESRAPDPAGAAPGGAAPRGLLARNLLRLLAPHQGLRTGDMSEEVGT